MAKIAPKIPSLDELRARAETEAKGESHEPMMPPPLEHLAASLPSAPPAPAKPEVPLVRRLYKVLENSYWKPSPLDMPMFVQKGLIVSLLDGEVEAITAAGGKLRLATEGEQPSVEQEDWT